MPVSPHDRMTDLQRQYEASQARLEQINAQQREREKQWQIEDQERREQDRLARRAAKAQREAEKKEREMTRRERQRSNKPPPRDSSPLFFSGTKQPKKTRTRYPPKCRQVLISGRRSMCYRWRRLTVGLLDQELLVLWEEVY
jgi:flagellar biosynthesis GTPase FlhF